MEGKGQWEQYNQGVLMRGNSGINSLFVDPPALLQALQDNGYIIPGKPNESEFFKLLEFRGGPMYHVFTEDEIKLWRDWTWELGEEDKKRRGRNVNALRDRLATLNSAVVASISDAQLRTWQATATDNRIGLWLEIASLEAANKGASSRTRGARAGASQQQVRDVVKSINDRFRNWLGWSMIRAVTYIPPQRWSPFQPPHSPSSYPTSHPHL